MKNIFKYIAIAIMSTFATMQSHAAETIKVKHTFGESTIPKMPKRVVVMDYSMLDNMQSLGVDVELALPQRLLPDHLTKYYDKKYTDVGSLKEFNLETISAFKPDLIIISGRQSDYYEELSKIAPVYAVNTGSTDVVGEAFKSIELIGKLFNKEEEAKKAIAEIQTIIDETKEKAAKSDKKALFVMVNDGSLSVFGSGGRFGALPFNVIGIKSADTEIKSGRHGQRVNYEYLAIKNPDIMYILDRSKAIGQEAKSSQLLENALVKRTKAVKNDDVVLLDGSTWYLVGSGIQSLKLMIKQIAEAL